MKVKDSLQHFEMNVKGALQCSTSLLESDDDMIDLQLTAKSNAKKENIGYYHWKVMIMLKWY